MESQNGMNRMLGTWVIRVGTWGIKVGMLEVRVGMRRIGGDNVQNANNSGNQVGDVGNQGRNAGNQGNFLWGSSCLLLRLKFWSASGAFHHSAFMGSSPTLSHTYLTVVDEFSLKEMRTFYVSLVPMLGF